MRFIEVFKNGHTLRERLLAYQQHWHFAHRVQLTMSLSMLLPPICDKVDRQNVVREPLHVERNPNTHVQEERQYPRKTIDIRGSLLVHGNDALLNTPK